MYSVILPTYNESKNITILCYLIRDVFESLALPYNLIVVDDGSTDTTILAVKKLQEFFPIDLYQRPQKLGLGSAYKYAISRLPPSCKYVIIMDTDLSHDPVYIKDMVRIQARGYDIVSGTRYQLGGVVGWPLYRRIISRGANNVSQIVTGVDISDFTGSYRLYTREVLEKVTVKSDGFSFQMEIINKAVKQKYSVAECPIIFYERINGVSKCGPGEIFRFVWLLVRMVLNIV